MDTGQGQMCDEGEEDLIQILFPANYAYKVMNCNATEYKGKYIQCNIELRVNVNNEESVKRFLSDFNTSQPALTMCKVEDQTNGQLGIQQGHSFEGSENAV